jgi:proteic killer suppression protein
MIRNFLDEETEKVWKGERSRKLPSEIQKTARRKLRVLNRATKPGDLRVPRNNRFEELKGRRKGTYSIRINDQWRICFRWVDGGAENVRIEDYHRG